MNSVTPPVHGALDPAEVRALGLDPRDILDFSASVNPLRTPPEVRRAIAQADPAAYPDRECRELRAALARRLAVDSEMLLPGNGATELVHLAARAWLPPVAAGASAPPLSNGPSNTALLLTPTFGEYEAACRLAGAAVHCMAAREEEGFRWSIPGAIAMVTRLQPRILFLCSPNNPTGVYLSESDVRSIAQSLGTESLLVLDEAYVPFVEEPWDSRSLLGLGNVALLRSMTKDYGLAGLRLGYLVAAPQTIARLRPYQPSWSVNAIAQAAGVTALGCEGHVAAGRRVVQEARAYLERELAGLGLTVLPSAANFLLVKVGDAASVRLALLHRGLCVRDCASFGLPAHIRIGLRALPDCQRLVAGLREVLDRG